MVKMTALMMVALVASVTLLTLARPAHGYDGAFQFYACNTQKTSQGSSLYKAIQSVISDLAQQTPFNGYSYKDSRSSGGVTAYGRGVCRFGLSDCTACLQDIGSKILSTCGNAIGARYQVVDCYMNYESNPIAS